MAAVSPRRPPPLLAVAAAGLILVAGTGCPKKGTPSEQLAVAPDMATETGQTKCGVRASAAKPLVVEWPAADRAALEARASRSLVAVRYQGCEMEVLTNCKVEGSYSYLGLNQKREGVRIKSVDELYAQLPVGAVALEGKLERAGQLNVDMVIIGRKEAERSDFNERDLEGRCTEATHVITGLTVGAFSFYAGASAEVGAGLKVGNIGVGGSSGTEREVLKQDGDEDSCKTATQADVDAPPGCGALLRVEVVPIDRIFGGGAPLASTSTGSSSSGSGYPSNSHDTTSNTDTSEPVDDPRNAGRRKVWAALMITGYGLGLAGLGGLYAGLYLRNKGKEELPGTTPGTPRQDALGKVNTGTIVLISSAAAASVGLVLGVFANARLKNTKQRSASIGPTVVPGGTGVAARVRF